jgi:hypothetical protein
MGINDGDGCADLHPRSRGILLNGETLERSSYSQSGFAVETHSDLFIVEFNTTYLRSHWHRRLTIGELGSSTGRDPDEVHEEASTFDWSVALAGQFPMYRPGYASIARDAGAIRALQRHLIRLKDS